MGSHRRSARKPRGQRRRVRPHVRATDDASGLRVQLVRVVGLNSKAGATMRVVRGLLRAVAAGNGGPLVFVSAFGVDGAVSLHAPRFWLARINGKAKCGGIMRTYRDRYDNAVAFLGPDSARSLYPIVVRPAPMYSLTVRRLAIAAVMECGSCFTIHSHQPMLPVDFVGEAIVDYLTPRGRVHR